MPLLDYVAPENRDASRRGLDHVFTVGESGGFELRGAPPFMPGAVYECRVAPNERDGRVVSATVIARDVTQLRSAEQRSRAARERLRAELETTSAELKSLQARLLDFGARDLERDRLRALIDDAGEALFVIDPVSGAFVDVNQTACRWFGHSRDKLLKMTSVDLDLGFLLDSPDEPRDHVADTRATARPAIRTGEVVRRSDGTSFTIEVSTVHRRVAGREYVLVLARNIDVGQRREAESREPDDGYRGLFELSHDPMYLSGRDGSVADANPAACRLFGYSREEFVGLPASKLYTKPGDIRAFQQAVGAHGMVQDLDVELVTRAAKIIRARLTVKYRSTPDASIRGYQCLIRPVSQELPTAGSRPQRFQRGRTVLVIDQDHEVLETVTDVLDRAGIPTVTTETPLAGVEVMRPQSGDIGAVLLGLDDNEGEPVEILRRVHHADTTVPIVLMSDELLGDDVEEGTLPGVVGVVRKPIYPLALVEQVRHAIR